ncbi:penicillin-binding protein 2 [Conexibacter sp. SYSU D00693]|uniref:peptidoglycan D,D-transpeptidase FtsI family protein n=1 Tax=Conexibacter sp. SYSU D00693 TaxID=2812560 RepID=UPI00196B03C1|nr:penicillin-binding protein 2 [Conexibacter sp. SYSU D00693]
MLVQRRIGLLFAAFLVLLSLAGLRALQLGVLSGDRYAQAATSQQMHMDVVPADRGSIVDRRGVELAVSEPADDISATPYLVKDPGAVARKLAPLLFKDPDEVLELLTRRDTGFVFLARQVPASRAKKVQELAIEGIDVTPNQSRAYPRDSLASQVLGTVGLDGDGLRGLEYRFDKLLKGHDGKRQRVRDGVGDAVSVRDVVPARPGQTVRLTIDANIQDKVEEVLKGLGATYSPKGATAVVMDPQTSEVLALANWPAVDANKPGAAPPYATQNRAVGATYEPGSTFKAITVAGALEEGVVKPDTEFDLPPSIQVADRTIEESHPRGPVTLSTAEILAQSSNVGAIKVGMALGDKRFDHWMRKFGFGRPTGVALPGEERGILPLLKNYSGSTMGNLPIGQGQSVTPMQMAQAYAAIANGGVLRTPRMVRSIGGEPVAAPRGKRVISQNTAAALRGMLKGVFAPGGTASEVHIPGYDLAGKTGTANKVDAATGEYSKANYIASFVGFAPTNRPKLLISVMVDEPHGAIYGGEVAAPAFGRIAAFALPYLGIEPR